MKFGPVNIKALRASARTLGQSGQIRQMRSAVSGVQRIPTPAARVRVPTDPRSTARALDRETTDRSRNKPPGR